jgi:hypothetical protein
MYAVPVDELNTIIFSPKAPPRGYEQYHGEVQRDVTLLGATPGLYDWPQGAKRPEVVLARSRVNPKEYKIFKYASELNGEQSDYEPTGRAYCAVSTSSQFIGLIKAVIRHRHRGKWIAWSEDGKRLLAAGRTPMEAVAAVERTGSGPAIFEWVEPALVETGR